MLQMLLCNNFHTVGSNIAQGMIIWIEHLVGFWMAVIKHLFCFHQYTSQLQIGLSIKVCLVGEKRLDWEKFKGPMKLTILDFDQNWVF